MEASGPEGYWLFLSVLMLAVAAYAAFRSVRRSRADMDFETSTYVPVAASTTPVIAEIAQDLYYDDELEPEGHDAGLSKH